MENVFPLRKAFSAAFCFPFNAKILYSCDETAAAAASTQAVGASAVRVHSHFFFFEGEGEVYFGHILKTSVWFLNTQTESKSFSRRRRQISGLKSQQSRRTAGPPAPETQSRDNHQRFRCCCCTEVLNSQTRINVSPSRNNIV